MTKEQEAIEIDKQIEDLQMQKALVEGTKTEIYTRIVGYYRSLDNWNIGKREEYKRRVLFDEAGERIETTTDKYSEVYPVEENIGFMFFYQKNCPNCPAMHDYLRTNGIDGQYIDAAEQMDLARKLDVMSTPTAIFYKGGEEIGRAYTVGEMKRYTASEA